MRKLMALVALVAGFALAAGGSAEIIVLKGGSRLELSKPYVVRGSQAILTLKDGTILSVAASEIDRDATAAARAAAVRKPAVTVAETPTSPADAAKAQQTATKAKVRLGDSDVGHDYAPASEDAGSDGASAASDARVDVSEWDQTPGDGSVTIHGKVRNSGGSTAESVGLAVSVRDENGKVTGSSTASLPSQTLEPGASMPFTASITAAGKVSSVQFRPQWAVPQRPKEKSAASPGATAAGPPAARAPKPAPPAEAQKPRYVPDPGYAPPAASATNQPDPDGHTGYLPGVEIPAPPAPPPPPPPPR